MNIDHLRFYALERPERLAVVAGGRVIRYRQLIGDVWKFAQAINALGVGHGGTIAIGCDDFYIHLLLILATEHLGIATASFEAAEGAASRRLLGSVDLVLAEPHFPPGGWATQAITPDWVAGVLSGPEVAPPPTPPHRPEDALRIIRTSGTTGEAKRFRVTRAMWQVRQARVIWLYREAPPDGALLLNLPLSIAGTYIASMWALNVGYTLVVARQAAMAQIPALITQHGITRISLLPMQLAQILDALPADWRRPPSLEILLFGAALPETLRRAALDRMASLVTEIYGSNEFSVATLTRASDSDGFGIICPDVQVEIVGEDGAVLPDGAVGEIRLRSPSAFSGYLDDPGLTRRMLRDGWFYPGDVGLRRGWQLKVIGRVDDHVNLGGAKYPLAAIEDIARRSAGAGVKDLAAAAVANEAGILEIHVAVVTDGEDDRALLERMVAVLRPKLPGGLHFIRLAEIPRNPAGKIDRTRLATVIAAMRAT